LHEIQLIFQSLSFEVACCLVLFVVLSAAFSFINGFHDTANAVATVIYTNALKPVQAVVWSGIFNFLGAWIGGVAVAMSIVALFPVAEVMNESFATIIIILFSVLFTAISWNLLTWYFGIPCTSSHTLMGSLVGAGIGFSLIVTHAGINWSLIFDMVLALIISPAFGFSAVILLLSLFRVFIKNKTIFEPPKKNQPPPFWIRGILIGTCTGVSFFHGSNDGQKGIGLVMIILIAFLPLQFTLNNNFDSTTAFQEVQKIKAVLENNRENSRLKNEIISNTIIADELLNDLASFSSIDKELSLSIKQQMQQLQKNLRNYAKNPSVIKNVEERELLVVSLNNLSSYTDYAPYWVIMLISLSIGIGTMIGWKRIVVTIGERIGKTHITYAQGAAAEIVAASTIGLSTGLGLPVSTTHVLSSGIAGSMVASDGVKNLRQDTVKNILIVWVLTLPVTIIFSGGLFIVLHFFFGK
jgi:PiT family inorganic phosphate transporter